MTVSLVSSKRLPAFARGGSESPSRRRSLFDFGLQLLDPLLLGLNDQGTDNRLRLRRLTRDDFFRRRICLKLLLGCETVKHSPVVNDLPT